MSGATLGIFRIRWRTETTWRRHWHMLVHPTPRPSFAKSSKQSDLAEVMAHVGGNSRDLPDPVAYRNYVAQTLAYARTSDAETFFREKLQTIRSGGSDGACRGQLSGSSGSGGVQKLRGADTGICSYIRRRDILSRKAQRNRRANSAV